MLGFEAILIIHRFVLRQQCGDFLAQDTVELGSRCIFIPGNTLFNAFDDLDGRFHAHIRAHQYIFQFIQNVLVDSGLTHDRTRELAKEGILCFFEALI
ncbi:hypothetical protein D3C86_2001030 [compost metagenome]